MDVRVQIPPPTPNKTEKALFIRAFVVLNDFGGGV
jgi:hypothetical protein